MVFPKLFSIWDFRVGAQEILNGTRSLWCRLKYVAKSFAEQNISRTPWRDLANKIHPYLHISPNQMSHSLLPHSIRSFFWNRILLEMSKQKKAKSKCEWIKKTLNDFIIFHFLTHTLDVESKKQTVETGTDGVKRARVAPQSQQSQLNIFHRVIFSYLLPSHSSSE